MEEAGRIRRGYFVDGLGAAQFALPGAMERLRPCAMPAARPRAGGAPPGRGGPGEPVWRRDLPGRGGATTTGVRSSAPPGPTSCWSTGWRRCTSTGREDAPGPGGGRPEMPWPAPPALRVLVSDGRIRELVIAKSTGAGAGRRPRPRWSPPGSWPGTVGRAPARPPVAVRALHARGRHPPSDRRGLRRTSSGARCRRRFRAPGRAAVEPACRLDGHGVEAVGKNLLIRFDNGLSCGRTCG